MTRSFVFLLFLLLFSVVFSHDPMSEHCARFRQNYEVYCRGIWTPEKLMRLSHHLDRIERFCPNYKKFCLTSEEMERRAKKLRKRHRKKLEKFMKTEMTYEDIQERLAEIIPCTPECNVLKYSHCTTECKCDYDWKTFRKFCFADGEQPTLKEFETTCSEWFARCPQYEEYADDDGAAPEREIIYHPPLDQQRRILYKMG